MKKESHPGVVGAPTLSPLFLARLSRRGALPDPFGSRTVRTYYQARYAIWHALRALGIKPGENVAFPALHCSAELDAFVDLGIGLRFYGIDDSLRVRFDSLESAIDDRTRALFVIHYFGLPQRMDTIGEFCRRKGLRLIEDCAHTIRGFYGDRLLGTFGDASIFSMRKLLPLPDGGALRINDPAIDPPEEPAVTPPCGRTVGGVRRSISRNLETQQGPLARVLRARVLKPAFAALKAVGSRRRTGPSLREDQYEFVPERIHWGMSSLSRAILRSTPLDEVCRRRCENFHSLAMRLGPTTHVKTLALEIPENFCPWLFPVLVDRPEAFVAHLMGRGIEVSEFWQRFHPAFPRNQFPAESAMKERLLPLPVHHQLGERHMRWIAETVLAWNGS